MTKIELSNEEIELFKEFRKYQDLFTTLLQSGAFKTKWGQVTLNFNAEGVLHDIKISTTSYHLSPLKGKELDGKI